MHPQPAVPPRLLRLADAGDAKPAWITLLTTEHYTLGMQRAATISEVNTRGLRDGGGSSSACPGATLIGRRIPHRGTRQAPGNRFMLHRNQAHAPYFGGELHERTLVPAVGARLAETRFDHPRPAWRRK